MSLRWRPEPSSSKLLCAVLGQLNAQPPRPPAQRQASETEIMGTTRLPGGRRKANSFPRVGQGGDAVSKSHKGHKGFC